MSLTLFGCEKGSQGSVVVIGLSFDQGSTTHPGCQYAPQVLRKFSAGMGLKSGSLYNLSTRKHEHLDFSLSDVGDLAYKAHQRREDYFARVQKALQTLMMAGKTTLTLGGDHLMTLPCLAAAKDVYSELQVIQIDAHTDFQRVNKYDQPTHANFMHFVAEEDRIKQILQIGVRGFCREAPLFPEKIKNLTVESLQEELMPGVPIYLTIDMDGFDPSIAPAVGHPVIDGLKRSDLLQILKTIEDSECQVIGADWMEYNPQFDTKNQLGALFSAACLLDISALLDRQAAKSRGAGGPYVNLTENQSIPPD